MIGWINIIFTIIQYLLAWWCVRLRPDAIWFFICPLLLVHYYYSVFLSKDSGLRRVNPLFSFKLLSLFFLGLSMVLFFFLVIGLFYWGTVSFFNPVRERVCCYNATVLNLVIVWTASDTTCFYFSSLCKPQSIVILTWSRTYLPTGTNIASLLSIMVSINKCNKCRKCETMSHFCCHVQMFFPSMFTRSI